ncbi:MAG: DUF5119 domain-containing protein [Rikenellaceae bacterium]
MKKILYIIGICLVALSCERRELTYDYSPYCEVLVNVDWSNMSEAPTGMSIRAYPEDGGEPIVVQSNTITSGTLKLPAGVYNILVFNQIPSDFGTVGFRGLDKWETAEVYSVEDATKSWATTKADETIVREPEDIAVATYEDVEICEDCIQKSTEQYELTGERIVAETLNLKPRIVVKRTFVRVKVDGISNLRSTRGVLTGMSDGYNFSTQQSFSSQVSHVLENWTIEDFEYGDQFGETNIYFMSFGLPETTTTTRVADDWQGSIYLQILLVDNKTIIEHTADISQNTTTNDDEETRDADVETDVDVDVETNITVEVGLSGSLDDPPPVLPNVKPEGSSSSGFDATVEDWGDEESYDLPV